MPVWLSIIIFVVGFILIMFFISFRKIYKIKEDVDSCYLELDKYLKKRWELLDNFLIVFNKYPNYLRKIEEYSLLDYTKMNIDEKINRNNILNDNLSKLLILGQNNPDIKSTSNFLILMDNIQIDRINIDSLSDVFNNKVSVYNEVISKFPYNIVSKIVGYKEYHLYENKGGIL